MEQPPLGSGQDPAQQTRTIARDRPKRQIRPPIRFGYDDDAAFALISDFGEPLSYSEAISHPEQAKWTQAMLEEVESLHQNETWDLVPLPHEKRAIGCK